jgi:hypothetical protein
MAHATQDLQPHSVALHTRAPAARRFGSKVANRLTWLVAALALAAALAGLLIDGVYTGEVATAAMFRGFDLVTAAVVVPSLAVACRLAWHGSVRAQLISASLVAYLAYTYAYYLFGTGFNDLFLLHAAVFASGVAALVLSLVAIDVEAVAGRFSARTRVRTIAGVLGVLAVALGGMWVYFAADYAVSGDLPAGSQLVETDTIVHLGIALDLTLLVPLYAAAAVLIWRRTPWGYLLAAVAVFAGLLHQVSYVVAMPFQAAADVPGAVWYDPIEPVIVLVYLVAAILLLRGTVRASGTTSGR